MKNKKKRNEKNESIREYILTICVTIKIIQKVLSGLATVLSTEAGFVFFLAIYFCSRFPIRKGVCRTMDRIAFLLPPPAGVKM